MSAESGRGASTDGKRRRLRVAVVMPVRNEESKVDETLDALFASTRLPDEIVVADGRSTDMTVERILRFADRGVPLTVVDNPTIYAGGGRNAAIRATTAEVVLFVDFGNPVFPGYIEHMVRPFEERVGVDVTMGIVVPRMSTPFEEVMGAVYFEDNLNLGKLTREEKEALLPKVLLPGSNCIGMTRQFFDRMGGFPEWLPKAQDRLFSRKAWCHGANIAVAWEAISFLHVRESALEALRMAHQYGKGCGQARYVRRHLLKVLMFYPVVVGLLAVGLFQPVAALLGSTLFAGYVYKAGLRRVIRAYGGLRRPVDVWNTATLLVASDLGTVTGQVAGWLDWILVSDFRAKFRDYTKDCPRDLLHVLEQ